MAREERSSGLRRAAPIVLPAAVFPVAEAAGITAFGMANALLLAVAFVVFTVLFQRLAGGWN